MSVPSLFRGKDRTTLRNSSGQRQDANQSQSRKFNGPMSNYQQQLANQKARAKERDER